MTLPVTGPISLANLQAEFGGATPTGINNYYSSNSVRVPTSVPSGGALALSNFAGTTAAATGNVKLISSGTELDFVDNVEDPNRHFVILSSRFSAGGLSIQSVPTVNGVSCNTAINVVGNGGGDGGQAGIFTIKIPTGTGTFRLGNASSNVSFSIYRVTGCFSMAIPLDTTSTRATQSLTSSARGCFFGIAVRNFGTPPTPIPSTTSLVTVFGNPGTHAVANATTSTNQTVILDGNQINAGATFAYDIY